MSFAPRQLLRLETIDDVTVVEIAARRLIDQEEIEDFGNQLLALVLEGKHRLVLNFANIQLMSSSAIGKLFSLMKAVNAAGGQLRLCALPKDLEEVFGVWKPFPIPIDKDEATSVSHF